MNKDEDKKFKPFTPRRSSRLFPSRSNPRTIALGCAIALALFWFGGPILPALGWRTQTKHWPGWPGIKHMVFFGDSYSSIGFSQFGKQVSKENPFGNPPLPGNATQLRPNWVDFLVTRYNSSFVDALDFAMGGATVDDAIVPQFMDHILPMKKQVRTEYMNNYFASPVVFPWRFHDALFVFWIGINDINKLWLWENGTKTMAQDLAMYETLVEEVYNTGAKNFLFLNVPPIDRAPEMTLYTADQVTKKMQYIQAWNDYVATMATNFTIKHPETTVFQYDAHKAYTAVLDNPCSQPESCGIKNTTGYCDIYAQMSDKKELNDWNYSDDKCAYPIHQYFWVDHLHHTYRMHNVTARGVFRMLNETASNFYTPT